MEDEYISLQEATKFCNYSQEYLSLRARQGKLKAAKFGKNWVTKKEWLEEYLKRVEEYNNNFKVKKFVALTFAPAFANASVGKKTTVGEPPENLPVEAEPQKFEPVLKVRFSLFLALAVISLGAGIVFGRDSFKSVYPPVRNFYYGVFQDLESYVGSVDDFVASDVKEISVDVSNRVEEIGQVEDFLIKEVALTVRSIDEEIGKSFREGLLNIKLIFLEGFNTLAEDFSGMESEISKIGRNVEIAAITTQEISKGAVETYKDFGQWLFSSLKGISQAVVKGVKKISKEITRGYLATYDFFEEKISQEIRQITEGGKTIERGAKRFAEGTKLLSSRLKIESLKFIQHLKNGYSIVSDFVEEKINRFFQIVKRPCPAVPEKPLVPESKAGVVVVPYLGEETDKVKEKLEGAFSDEVKVEPKDRTKGIIKPIFKEASDQEYLYIIVPVKGE